MSYQDGWAALNLEMPPRVPRTEYSAESHWELINAVTGSNVSSESDWSVRSEAAKRFISRWNYDFIWSVMIHSNYMPGRRTDMGHSEYAAGGGDRRDAKYCPFRDPEDVFSFDPVEEYGILPKAELIKAFEAHYKGNSDYNQEAVNSTGVYITMFSGLIEVFGWEMLLVAAGLDPKRFGAVAQRWETWISQYFEALADSSVPVVMCHDDIVWTSGPVIAPPWYREYIFPAYKRLWAPIIDSGKKLVYTSDGDYTVFIDDVVKAGAHCLVMEPCTDMAYVAEKYGKSHSFIGNADTRVLFSGTREQIYDEVKRCMDIGKGCPGFFMAVGNHIPANTPVENALYYNEVYEELSRR